MGILPTTLAREATRPSLHGDRSGNCRLGAGLVLAAWLAFAQFWLEPPTERTS